MGTEAIFILILIIIFGGFISALITYWCRSMFKHLREQGVIDREQLYIYYPITFLLMYIPGLNIIYLLGSLIVYEISNLKKL